MGQLITNDDPPVRMDAEDKKAQEINEYNESILNVEDEIKNLKGINNNVLIRPFKLLNIGEDGLVIPLKIKVPNQAGTKMISEDNPYPYQERGVVVNIAQDCPDNFKEVIKVGDVVFFDIKNFSQQQFQVDRRFPIGKGQDSKFTIKVHSSQITHKVGAI